jgi:hypothetical protein
VWSFRGSKPLIFELWLFWVDLKWYHSVVRRAMSSAQQCCSFYSLVLWSSLFPQRTRVCLQAIWLASIWAIWKERKKERNNRVFDHKKLLPNNVDLPNKEIIMKYFVIYHNLCWVRIKSHQDVKINLTLNFILSFYLIQWLIIITNIINTIKILCDPSSNLSFNNRFCITFSLLNKKKH